MRMKNKKIFVLGLLSISLLIFTGCKNLSFKAANTQYNYVQIKLQSGQVISGELEEYSVTGETVSCILKDGRRYSGSVMNFSFSTEKNTLESGT